MKQFVLFLSIIVMSSCSHYKSTDSATTSTLNYNTFCFYYNWYGNKEFDDRYIHWAHPVINQPGSSGKQDYISGKNDNLAANFYPLLGLYSNNNPETIEKHMKMVRDARIGVLAVTWWNESDTGQENIPIIMEKAEKYGVKICFHIEPFPGRNAEMTRQNIQKIIDTYGKHPAYYKMNGKPLFFVYDSYLTPANEWATLLNKSGEITIRNTPYDAVMVGLWVKQGEEKYFIESGFDGIYAYFASTGFTYGSTPDNWKYLQEWAQKNNKIFIPSVGPGYIDTRIRPWNASTTRDRNNGKYYDKMFLDAIQSGAQFISITSFNEWHEGTQIESAIPFKTDSFIYLDYGNLLPNYYLERTAYWISHFENYGK